jgi:hypothetical protein
MSALAYDSRPPISNTTQWGSKIKVGGSAMASMDGSEAYASGPTLRRQRSRGGGSGTSSGGGSAALASARSALGITPLAASAARRATSGELLVLADYNSLSYLDGTLPGDMGFDPLGLFSPECDAGFMNQRWLRYAEVGRCMQAPGRVHNLLPALCVIVLACGFTLVCITLRVVLSYVWS